jgi:hypothetical protein
VELRFNTFYNTKQGVLISWKSRNNTITRNLFSTIGTNYGAIRGFQLEGQGNVAQNNYVHRARHIILNDAGYRGVQDRGGNLMSSDPLFTSLNAGGFKPRANAAQQYGKYSNLTRP